MGSEGGCRGFHVVRFLDRWRRQRGFREGGVQHISFGAIGCFDFNVALHALDNLHRLAALKLGGHVEIGKGFVHPHAVFVGSALYVDGAAGLRGWNCSEWQKREEIPRVRVILPPKLTTADVVERRGDTPKSPDQEWRSRERCALRQRMDWQRSRAVGCFCGYTGSARNRGSHGVPQDPPLKIAQTCSASMRTSETPRQLPERLEMGQGRTVRCLFAPARRAGKQERRLRRERRRRDCETWRTPWAGKMS